jgi:hypothetical protein
MKRFRSVMLAVLGTCLVGANLTRSAEPVPPTATTEIGFASLEEATKALRAKPGVTFRNQSGWVVAEDTQASTVWLLTPLGHPAYPSIVKRTLVNAANGAHFETNIRCFASKKVCDKYFGSSNSIDKGADQR